MASQEKPFQGPVNPDGDGAIHEINNYYNGSMGLRLACLSGIAIFTKEKFYFHLVYYN